MERMTWNQIRIKYPDQWVGLMDVEFEAENNSAIKTHMILSATMFRNLIYEVDDKNHMFWVTKFSRKLHAIL